MITEPDGMRHSKPYVRIAHHAAGCHDRLVPRVSPDQLEARRQQILAGARACFARHGYEGATVRRLEEEIGLSRGAIFHHFRDKESLFLAVAEDDAAAMVSTVARNGLLQREFTDEQRATMGSFNSFGGSMAFAIFSFLLGALADRIGVIPALITVVLYGEQGTGALLILSQVILSLQLPFAVFPLVMFSTDRTRPGGLAAPAWMLVLAWPVAVIIAALNAWLLYQVFAASG